MMTAIYRLDSDEEEISSRYGFVKSLEHRLNKEKESLTKSVITGQVDSYEGYKYRIGIIQGLNLAIKHIEELKGK